MGKREPADDDGAMSGVEMEEKRGKCKSEGASLNRRRTSGEPAVTRSSLVDTSASLMDDMASCSMTCSDMHPSSFCSALLFCSSAPPPLCHAINMLLGDISSLLGEAHALISPSS